MTGAGSPYARWCRAPTPTASWTSSGSSARAASWSPTSTPAGSEATVAGSAVSGRRVFRPRRARVVVYVLAAAMLVTLVGIAFALPVWRRTAVGRRLAPRRSSCFALAFCVPLHRLAAVRVVTDDDGVTVVNVLRRHRLEWAQIVGVRLLAGRRLAGARPGRRPGAAGDGRGSGRRARRPRRGPRVRPPGERALPGPGGTSSRGSRAGARCARVAGRLEAPAARGSGL